MLTKRQMLEALIALHEYQIEIMPECVEAALEAGPPQSPAFMHTIQAKPRAMATEWVNAQYGLGDMMELVNAAIAMGNVDKEFGEAVQDVLTEYGGKLQQAAQEVMQTIIMQRMGGMGMGM